MMLIIQLFCINLLDALVAIVYYFSTMALCHFGASFRMLYRMVFSLLSPKTVCGCRWWYHGLCIASHIRVYESIVSIVLPSNTSKYAWYESIHCNDARAFSILIENHGRYDEMHFHFIDLMMQSTVNTIQMAVVIIRWQHFIGWFCHSWSTRKTCVAVSMHCQRIAFVSNALAIVFHTLKLDWNDNRILFSKQ